MKIIKNLTIKMTYRVGLGNVEVPDEVFNALEECYDVGGEVSTDGMTDEESVASGWLSDNIREADAMDWEYEIEDFEE